MSGIIYHVTIDKTGKENIFQVTWANKENIIHSFEQSASGITPEEMEGMWKKQSVNFLNRKGGKCGI